MIFDDVAAVIPIRQLCSMHICGTTIVELRPLSVALGAQETLNNFEGG